MKPVRPAWMRSPLVVLGRYWLLQGTLYMNWVERSHRIVVELAILVLTLVALSGVDNMSVRILAGLVLAHTVMAAIDGHVPAMLAHDLYWLNPYGDPARFFAYVDEMKRRLDRKAPVYLCGAVFFGSLARGEFKESSDLDIRFIPTDDGVWSSFLTAHLVFVERLRAAAVGFPLDAYMFRTRAEVENKMDVTNEAAVDVYSSGDCIRSLLGGCRAYDDYRRETITA